MSNCERSGPVPSTPPGGKFARFGPYDTRLVYLENEQTSAYGFPSAVVACPVLPLDVTRGDRREDRRGREKHFSLIKKLLRKNAAGTLKFPGLAWSSGGAGSCLGTDGFANAADGFSETMAGDHRGYWLPDLLHHAASWGIVAACPALAPGIPVGDGSETRGAAKMLADLQPCLIHRGDDDGTNTNASSNVLSGVKVDKRSLALAGYSLGGGRALRGAAGDRDGIVGAVMSSMRLGIPNTVSSPSIASTCPLVSQRDRRHERAISGFRNDVRSRDRSETPRGVARPEPLHVAEVLGGSHRRVRLERVSSRAVRGTRRSRRLGRREAAGARERPDADMDARGLRVVAPRREQGVRGVIARAMARRMNAFF